MGSRADRLNRRILTLVGCALLAAGVAGLLFGLGVFGEDVAQQEVLAPEFEDFVVEQAPWVWPLVVVVLALLAVLALLWLVQQLRNDRVGELDLTASRDEGETTVASAAVTDALSDAAERCAGVESASARVIQVKNADRLILSVRLADRADFTDVRQQLAAGPLTDLRHALGDDTPEVLVELEPSTRGRARVVA